MKKKLVCSAARLSQLPHVVRLKLAMFDESGHADMLADDAFERVLEDYKALYARGEACHFIALSGERIAAIAGAFIKSDVPFRYFKVPVQGFVGDVFTEPAFRRQGLALELSQQALDWLRSRGVQQVRLLASTQGRPIYQKLGFLPSDEMVLNLEPLAPDSPAPAKDYAKPIRRMGRTM